MAVDLCTTSSGPPARVHGDSTTPTSTGWADLQSSVRPVQWTRGKRRPAHRLDAFRPSFRGQTAVRRLRQNGNLPSRPSIDGVPGKVFAARLFDHDHPAAGPQVYMCYDARCFRRRPLTSKVPLPPAEAAAGRRRRWAPDPQADRSDRRQADRGPKASHGCLSNMAGPGRRGPAFEEHRRASRGPPALQCGDGQQTALNFSQPASRYCLSMDQASLRRHGNLVVGGWDVKDWEKQLTEPQ